MPEHSRHACSLWVAHTHLLDCTMITPRLGVLSPTPRCGKTTLLDVLGQFVARPLTAANVSASSVFRVIEEYRPTMLIDEGDSFLPDNEDLRNVLNSGHRRGGHVLRTVAVGDDFEVRRFSTFGACAIALIGRLPNTLADRSVPIKLTRRKQNDPIASFRLDRVEHFVTLTRKLIRWTKDNAAVIAATEPEMPTGLYNRVADNWRPLLAIATVAGGGWLARGRKAALASAGVDTDDMSLLELLIGDIRDVFNRFAHDPKSDNDLKSAAFDAVNSLVGDPNLESDVDPKLDYGPRIYSAHLVDELHKIIPRPWAEYGKSGKPITQNKLAGLLRPLHISAQVVRIRKGTQRGYYRHQFEEAWEQFLPPPLHTKDPL